MTDTLTIPPAAVARAPGPAEPARPASQASPVSTEALLAALSEPDLPLFVEVHILSGHTLATIELACAGHVLGVEAAVERPASGAPRLGVPIFTEQAVAALARAGLLLREIVAREDALVTLGRGPRDAHGGQLVAAGHAALGG